MSSTSQPFDVQELFHLALNDIQQGKHDGAIAKLKQALDLDASNAQIQFMLGAEHAEIGLYDRAIEEMSRALDLDGSMQIAWFQLGLLHYTKGDFDQARQTWHSLDTLAPDSTLTQFKSALLLIAEGQRQEAIAFLEQALQSAVDNAVLRGDIERVMQHNKIKLDEASEAVTTSGHALAHRYGDGT